MIQPSVNAVLDRGALDSFINIYSILVGAGL